MTLISDRLLVGPAVGEIELPGTLGGTLDAMCGALRD